jgi:hypothetical protein
MTEHRYSSLAGGLLLMGAGVLLVLHTQGRVDAWTLKPWWPLLLLVPAGHAFVKTRGCGSGWTGATAWLVMMVALLLDQRGYPVLRPRVLLSVALIAGGAYLIWRGPTAQAGRGGAA